MGGALKRFPDMHVTVEDVIAEGDKVVVRNTWQGTDRDSGKKLRFGGIVIWRVAEASWRNAGPIWRIPRPCSGRTCPNRSQGRVKLRVISVLKATGVPFG